MTERGKANITRPNVTIPNITILGAGSWGLTLASLLDTRKINVTLWDRNDTKLSGYRANRRIQKPFDLHLPDSVVLVGDLNTAITDANVILLAVTTSGTRPVMEQLVACASFNPAQILLNASKGIELPGLNTLLDVIDEFAPSNPKAVLSGPNLAPEIAQGLPTAGVIACRDEAVAKHLQQLISTERYRIYTNTDTTGVQLAGALKNVFAICSGFMQGRNLGDNAKATLITRGLIEMTRFSLAMGADAETLYGLSGLGDLLATCNSPLSRNYQVGLGLAAGKTIDDILQELGTVAEGVKTTQAVSLLADKMGVDMPVVKLVEQALMRNFTDDDLINTLMKRKLKAEEKLPIVKILLTNII